MEKHPTLGNGKVCYIEIPAESVDRSATFYQNVFGWNVRTRSNGTTAFDDGVGEVSGTWVKGRDPETDPSILIYIMVDDMSAAIKAIEANGGMIVQPVGKDEPEVTARFSDPAGNVFGLYQEAGK